MGAVFIGTAKQLSGYHYADAFGSRLWQRYSYEHVLRGDEETLGVARYILENPVRAQLVTTVQEYPFLGSKAYTIHEILMAAAYDPKGGWQSSG